MSVKRYMYEYEHKPSEDFVHEPRTQIRIERIVWKVATSCHLWYYYTKIFSHWSLGSKYTHILVSKGTFSDKLALDNTCWIQKRITTSSASFSLGVALLCSVEDPWEVYNRHKIKQIANKKFKLKAAYSPCSFVLHWNHPRPSNGYKKCSIKLKSSYP